MKLFFRLAGITVLVLFLPTVSSAAAAADTVTFQSGAITLHGLLYKPEGTGPFPAVLYNHGSAPGTLSNEAFVAIAPAYVGRGWVFFAPYRRGQGLSASAGPYIGSQIATARRDGLKRGLLTFVAVFVGVAILLLVMTRRRRGWMRGFGVAILAVITVTALYLSGTRAAAAEMVRVLETDHLNDQVAAYDWLRMQDFVDVNRIAVAGNSFGGIEVVLGANLAPSHTLSAAMKDAGKVAEMKIYPAFGNSAADGHSFTWLGSSMWADDVFAFFEKYCHDNRHRD